jgi:hypothetical protein
MTPLLLTPGGDLGEAVLQKDLPACWVAVAGGGERRPGGENRDVTTLPCVGRRLGKADSEMRRPLLL